MTSAVQPQYNRENVLVGLASVYLQPYDPATPPVLPDFTVPLNGAWETPWTPIGATEEGLTFAFSRETNDLQIEEQVTPIDVQTESLEWNLNFTFAEDTLTTMRIAYGGGTITNTAATATDPGTQKLVISSTLERFAAGFEGVNEFGFPRRVLVPVVASVGEIETPYRRSENYRTYAVSLRSLVAPEDVEIVEMTAEATG